MMAKLRRLRSMLSRLTRRQIPNETLPPVLLEDGTHWAATATIPGYSRFDIVIDCESSHPLALEFRTGTGGGPMARSLLTHGPLAIGLLAQFRLNRPNARVLDLGAHWGLFALAAAAAGCQVIAVEASAKHVDLLHRSARRNDFSRLSIVHAAVSDRAGYLEFHSNEEWGMVHYPTQGAASMDTVPAVAVDDLLEQEGWPSVDLVKIDIEGSEVAALRGMQRLLSRDDAPIIVCEANAGTLPCYGLAVDDLTTLLEAHGYTLHRSASGRLRPFSSRDLQPEAVLDLVALRPWHMQRVKAALGPPLSLAETIELVEREAAQRDAWFRRHLANVLAHADPVILADARIQAVLDGLRHDADNSVREAAGWWEARSHRAA
jgi:FkbM family methyltransferase